MSTRAGITVVFFVNGALFATWASRIPAFSNRVDATTGVLGSGGQRALGRERRGCAC
jgi:hypothetical protein